jgi:sulfide:quinone oxidoreductase
MASAASPRPFEVVIAGGGVAGAEAALALHELAPHLAAMTLLTPDTELRYRPVAVREPFGYAAVQSYPIAGIARDTQATLLADALAWVDPARRVVHTAGGEQLGYDALLLALGARAVARYEHAITLEDRRLDEILHGIVQDIEGRFVRSVAFLAPPRTGWPLPLYELALMTAGRALDMELDLDVSLVTPEERPLAIFGHSASAGVADLLERAGIGLHVASYAEVPRPGEVVIHPGERRLRADRVLAAPELFGPAVRGLQAAEHGFIPIDRHGHVRGAERVFAAGDASDFAVKHGGIAAQQADAAAEAIAALAGAQIEPAQFDPVIHGMLLTDERPRYLSASLAGGRGESSTFSEQPTWSPPTKIAARYLAPYLEQRDAQSASSQRQSVA